MIGVYNYNKIGYLENGNVKHIFSAFNGQPSCNGVILLDFYSDIQRVKNLVNRNGEIVRLGSKFSNTAFRTSSHENLPAKPLDWFKSSLGTSQYGYIFDAERSQWRLFHQGKEVALTDVINHASVFAEFEPNGGQESFSKMCEFRENLKNCYQVWDHPQLWMRNEGYFSYYNSALRAVEVFNASDEKKCRQIPCTSLERAHEISDKIFGSSVEEIARMDFRPALDEQIRSCEGMNKNDGKGSVERDLGTVNL